MQPTDKRQMRRTMLRGALAVPAASFAGPALSRTSPNVPTRLIVGFAPGGSADAVARATAAGITAETGQTVIVDNRPGGQLKISMQALTGSASDGQRLIYMTGAYLAIQSTQRLYDIEAQTTPITNTISTPIVMLVKNDSPYRSVTDLFEAAKRGREKASFGVITLGGIEHFKLTQMERTVGFKGLVVPYNSGPDGIKGLISGDIDCMIGPGIFAKTFAGRLRALAVLGARRWEQVPEIPTLNEMGVPVPPTTYWGGWSAPAGVSDEDAAALARLIAKVSQQPTVLAQLQATGHDLQLSEGPRQFRSQIRSELAWMSEVAKIEGLIGK